MMETIASRVSSWIFGVALIIAPSVHAQTVFDLAGATDREIVARVTENVEATQDAREEVDALVTNINPSGDSAAAELARLSPILEQLEGYEQVAEEYAQRVSEILPDRSSRMASLQQAFDMTEIAAARARNLLAQATQGSNDASRYTGDTSRITRVDPTIPTRDTTESGEVTDLAQTEAVDERGVDSPNF